MNSPTAVLVVRCMIRDTIRQSLASRTFWLLLGLSGLCILLCLSVGVEGATAVRPPGEIELFGADHQPYTGLNQGRGVLSLGFGAVRVEQSARPRFLRAFPANSSGHDRGRGGRDAAAAPLGERLPARISSTASRVGATDQTGPALGLAGGQVPGRGRFRGDPDRHFRGRHLGGPRSSYRNLARGLPRQHPLARGGICRPLQLFRRPRRVDAEHGRLRRGIAAAVGTLLGRQLPPAGRRSFKPRTATPPRPRPSSTPCSRRVTGCCPNRWTWSAFPKRRCGRIDTSARCRRCGRWSRTVPTSSSRF